MTRTCGALKEAKAAYASIVQRRYEAERAPLNQVTVDEWLGQRLSMKAEHLDGSMACSCTMTSARVRGRLGLIRFQDLTGNDVEAWTRCWDRVKSSAAGVLNDLRFGVGDDSVLDEALTCRTVRQVSIWSA
ncbi:hypothetical protein [Streptomyces sp. NRRL F-5527]|uniref:hypothetical protein n=1 Tax=Streptomyces sp. NRRL F-5527 TaxID=1463862 RepID=UPI0004C89F8A|nr:hypothetical protein [Streptomyces sp. NRRL F-5527]